MSNKTTSQISSQIQGQITYYSATVKDKNGFEIFADKFGGELDVDVAIIGGGFSGIATALELAERGVRVAVFEANEIGSGATGRNGGQITGSLSGDVAMEREFGRQIGDEAKDYIWNLRWRGHEIIKSRVEKYKIECDLKFGHLQTAYKPSHMDDLQKIYDEACARGLENDVQLLSKADIPDLLDTKIYHGGLLNRKNMHVHSLDLCRGEARAAELVGARIFEHSKVLKIEQGARLVLHLENGTVKADKVLIAGNAYHLLEQRQLGGKLFPASLANMATEPLGEELAKKLNPQNLAVYDNRFVLDYYRLTADNRLMFGGGTNYSGHDSANVARELRPAMEHTFPQIKGVGIDYAWTGRDGIIINRIPQVGRINNSIYYVQGYSGHGIGLSHIMAQIMAEAMMGNLREFNLFENVRHLSLPFSRGLGSYAIALGMLYYRMREALR